MWSLWNSVTKYHLGWQLNPWRFMAHCVFPYCIWYVAQGHDQASSTSSAEKNSCTVNVITTHVDEWIRVISGILNPEPYPVRMGWNHFQVGTIILPQTTNWLYSFWKSHTVSFTLLSGVIYGCLVHSCLVNCHFVYLSLWCTSWWYTIVECRTFWDKHEQATM